MLILILLAIAVIAVAFYARTCGRNPWIWGLIALAGHLAISFLTAVLYAGLPKVEGTPAYFFLGVAPFLWPILVAFYLWFAVDPNKTRPRA